MQATSKTQVTQWNSLWAIFTTLDTVWNGSSLVRYLSTVKLKLLLAKAVQRCVIPGLYSGIFAIYLQHRGSQQSTNRANNILFYALWVLYALTTATIILDTLEFCWLNSVSVDDHRCLNFVSINFTDHRDSVPPWNYSNHNICSLWRHGPIYPSTHNWQWLLSFI